MALDVVSFPFRIGTKFRHVMSPTSGLGGVFMVVLDWVVVSRARLSHASREGLEEFIMLAVDCRLKRTYLLSSLDLQAWG